MPRQATMTAAALPRRVQFLVCGFALLLAGCGGESDSATDRMTIEQLSGPKWQLQQMTQAGKKTVIPRAVSITLRVEANGRLSGRSAINRYFGQLKELDDGSVSMDMGAIASTRTAGPPERMALEQAYLSALTTCTRAKRGTDTLTLLSKNGTTVLEYKTAE